MRLAPVFNAIVQRESETKEGWNKLSIVQKRIWKGVAFLELSSFFHFQNAFFITLSPNVTTASSSLSSSSRLLRLSNSSLTKSVKRKSDDEENASSSSQSSSDSLNTKIRPRTPNSSIVSTSTTKVISCSNKQRQVFPNDEFYVCSIADRDYFIQKQATVGAPLSPV